VIGLAMLFATDIRPGDAVLCTVGAPLGAARAPSSTPHSHLRQGRVYRVRELVGTGGEIGLRLSGVDEHPISGFRASAFRKIRPAEPDFIRACRAKFSGRSPF
jgi:hypothetical protein